jgi:hypothetical protein
MNVSGAEPAVAAPGGRLKTVGRRIGWWVYAVATALVVLDPLFAAAGPALRWLPFLGAGIVLLVLPVLIALYWRTVGQWRTLIALALLSVGLELVQGWLGAAGPSPLARAAGTLVAILRLEGMITLVAALVILAVRRDVSVAYIVLSFGLGAWLVYAMVRDAGGVLAFFVGPLMGNAPTGLNVFAPLVANTSCMATLGLLTFIPHFAWVVWKELNAGKRVGETDVRR